ncbi:MAG: hypothetical protein ACLUVG_10990 [Phocaeicola vulgatus]
MASGDWYRNYSTDCAVLDTKQTDGKCAMRLYIAKLKRTLDICSKITASVPSDASEMDDVHKRQLHCGEMRISCQLVGAIGTSVLSATKMETETTGTV